MRMGIPQVKTSDNGKQFKNELDNEISNNLGIKRIFPNPLPPSGNCMIFSITLFNLYHRQMESMKGII